MAKAKKEFVLVRTDRAGVHCGFLEKHENQNVHLSEARRVWRWSGANSLHELAQNGAKKEYTCISEPVSDIKLTDAIEVLSCSPAGAKDLQNSRWNR